LYVNSLFTEARRTCLLRRSSVTVESGSRDPVQGVVIRNDQYCLLIR
jgi:hypothetical protein